MCNDTRPLGFAKENKQCKQVTKLFLFATRKTRQTAQPWLDLPLLTGVICNYFFSLHQDEKVIISHTQKNVAKPHQTATFVEGGP